MNNCFIITLCVKVCGRWLGVGCWRAAAAVVRAVSGGLAVGRTQNLKFEAAWPRHDKSTEMRAQRGGIPATRSGSPFCWSVLET